MVALRKESVDRNTLSLSFRPVAGVALRKESVDRNRLVILTLSTCLMSLSARRAWIEITGRSVEFHLFACRSPQGERG